MENEPKSRKLENPAGPIGFYLSRNFRSVRSKFEVFFSMDGLKRLKNLLAFQKHMAAAEL